MQGVSSTQRSCIKPASNVCSFEQGLCSFSVENAANTTTSTQGAIIENMPYHEHTFETCRGKPILY